MSTSRSPEQKRDFIIELLTGLKLPDVTINAAREELENKVANKEDISVPGTLDTWLIELIPNLYANRLHSDRNQERFDIIVMLYFSGDVSQEALDVAWKQLSEDEKILYTTKEYKRETALNLAAKNGNKDALLFLDETYEELLSRRPDLRESLHTQLVYTLKILPEFILSLNHKTAYIILLNMCVKHAAIDQNAEKSGFSNKQFKLNKTMESLLNVFNEICKFYSNSYNTWIPKLYAWAIFHLSLFVRDKGTKEEYELFQANLSACFNENNASLQEAFSKLQENSEKEKQSGAKSNYTVIQKHLSEMEKINLEYRLSSKKRDQDANQWLIDELQNIEVNAFGHLHKGLQKINEISNSRNQDNINQPEWTRSQIRDIVNECKSRTSIWSITSHYSFFVGNKRAQEVDLLYRSIAEFDENIKSSLSPISNLEGLIKEQQKREAAKLFTDDLSRLQAEQPDPSKRDKKLKDKIDAYLTLINTINGRQNAGLSLQDILDKCLDNPLSIDPTTTIRKRLEEKRGFTNRKSTSEKTLDKVLNSELCLCKEPAEILDKLFPKKLTHTK